jgi:hypothetical protein
MAFLDNSGDIILDAVLTDTGRLRLARGDGSFRIAKFVFADDEINYGLYDKNNASGSAYYDLDILQTPIFEAFTNNTSVVKHPLLSISKTNLLYLPVMKLNTSSSTTGDGSSTNNIVGSAVYSGTGTYLISVDSTTFSEGIQVASEGLFEGELLTTIGKYIRIDQGIDSNVGSPAQPIDSFLNETQYVIEIDNRLGSIVSSIQNSNPPSPSFIDDDNIASYYFTLADSQFVEQIKTNVNDLQAGQVIAGPRGTCLGFQIKASQQLRDSTYLFTTLGSTLNLNKIAGGGSLDFYYIDTNIVVKGVTTGTSITIPVKFIKSIV